MKVKSIIGLIAATVAVSANPVLNLSYSDSPQGFSLHAIPSDFSNGEYHFDGYDIGSGYELLLQWDKDAFNPFFGGNPLPLFARLLTPGVHTVAWTSASDETAFSSYTVTQDWQAVQDALINEAGLDIQPDPNFIDAGVPDGGTTFAMLGASVIGLACLKRK